MNLDSFDKVVESYFTAVAAQPFEYKGRMHYPRVLNVSPAFFHDYTCKLGCAGCCASRFTLDYLPKEERPVEADGEYRTIEINGRKAALWTIRQEPKGADGRRHCDMVNMETGACTIHEANPFTCDFETLRFVHYSDHCWLGTRPYGRGWAMMRVDGMRGAQCEFPKVPTEQARSEAIRKLTRLQQWAEHCGIKTYILKIIAWAERVNMQDNNAKLTVYADNGEVKAF